MIFRNSLRYSLLLFTAFLIAFFVSAPTQAQGSGPSIIRDTEIEAIFKEWTLDIFKAADIDPNTVNIILVQSPDINAFVAGGANIFFYTGLIERTEDPGEMIGVFAHELGHIAGGHLIRGRDAIERASFESILGVVLGIGTAIATGNGEAASAIIAGSSNVAARRYLAHSRINESSADQAAMTFFEKAKMNPEGLATFLKKLESEELLPSSQQSEYVRTHPLTSNRIEAVKDRSARSAYIENVWPAKWLKQHARMKAKLTAFISPGRVPWVYNDQDTSIPAQYARAIAHYRQNNIDQAIKGIDRLLTTEPENPYFLELKGQMLVDFGQVKEAIPYYQKAAEILPRAGLIRIALGHALLESGQGEQSVKDAITHLERALQYERRSTRAHRLLATAYGRLGNENIAKLHLAEEAVLQRRYAYAHHQAEFLAGTLPEHSREWIKAKDILSFIDAQGGIDSLKKK